ncbi:MAG: FtsW/RodA/SpoVE family cell cycle protein [Planctomycetota bacterium]
MKLLRGARVPAVTLIVSLASLLWIGTIFVHSATTGAEVPFPGAQAREHFQRIAFGMVFLSFFLVFDYRQLKHLAPLLYAAGLGLLCYLLVTKYVSSQGVVRWIRFGYLNLQPAELLKVFTVLLLARVLIPGRRPPQNWDQLLPFLIVGVPTVLVSLQPDLGTALVMPPALVAMLWTSGISGRRLFNYGAIAAALMPAAWFVLHEYQRMRLRVFLNPYEENPIIREASFQLRQSITAIGSGGTWGKGVGLGTQNYLGYLPEGHNDFIFAVIGEEWGLVGTLSVVALYLLLYVSCFAIAYRTREPFGRLVVVGITAELMFQTFINIAMTTGWAPVTGLPLPFVSWGGTALFVYLAALGIILGIALRPVRMVTPDGLQHGTSFR